MSTTYEFYDARAKEAAAEAAVATLDNVRERALRSESAWRGMAEQALKTAEARVVAEGERLARREAEAELAEAGMAAELAGAEQD